MKTAIMTDTNSGITAALGEKLGIHVLPMPVSIDENGFLEGIDITHTALFAALREGRNVHSSQPSPGAVTDRPVSRQLSGIHSIMPALYAHR